MTLKNLRDFMHMRELTADQVAKSIGATPRTFEAKLAESIPFTIDEAKAIRDKFFPGTSLDGPFGVFESDGDVPTESERLHGYAEAIGNSLTKDGAEPDPEVDEIVQKFHDCAEAYAESEAR